MALPLDVEQGVDRALPGAGNLATLVLMVDQDERDSALGQPAYVGDEQHVVAYLLQGAGDVHTGSCDVTENYHVDLEFRDFRRECGTVGLVRERHDRPRRL